VLQHKDEKADMKEVIIDGNNLIGKIKNLSVLQKRDKITAREKLAFMLNRYYSNKKIKVSLHFDGFKSVSIRTDNISIIYSDEITADEKIKKQIEQAKNSRNIALITSDRNLQQFAKACSCEIISCEDFSKMLGSSRHRGDEQSRIDEMNNVEEFKKLFNAK
jgi:predicted RNA-binding protein with PIN domain